MTTRSKYFTPDDLAKAKAALDEIKGEETELDLAERAGLDVSQARQDLRDAKSKLQKIIATYEVANTSTRSKRGD